MKNECKYYGLYGNLSSAVGELGSDRPPSDVGGDVRLRAIMCLRPLTLNCASGSSEPGTSCSAGRSSRGGRRRKP